MRKLPPIRDGRKTMPDGLDVRPIPSAPGYLVSEDGRVYSDTDPPLLMAAQDKPGRKTMRRRVRLCAHGRIRRHYVAALVLESWVGPRPALCVAQHYDGDPLNCHVSNLFWGHPQTRIDPREFVRVWQSSGSVREAAERLGVEYATAMATSVRMRDHGVKLKQLVSTEDYADLAALADQLANESLRD